jgi:hypothetical protein
MGPRPVVRCIVAWWPWKQVNPVVRPSGVDCWEKGKRKVEQASMTLEKAASLAALGYEVIVDPFDMEELTLWEQRDRSARG